MANCERCKEKITLINTYIFHDTETGETKKYCQACADTIRLQNEEKRSMMKKKEKEETIEKITEERVQKIDNLSNPESELLMMKDMKTEEIENHEMNQTFSDIGPRDMIIDRINSCLSDEPLNIGKDDYCYIKIVGNHLEIGRAKIILEE